MPETYYLVHTAPDCPWCTRALALLSSYGAEYRTTIERCKEYPTVPAVYIVSPLTKELIGGYDKLCTLALKDGL